MKAFITFYSDEVLHFKRVLIEIKAFILRKTSCLCRIFLTLSHVLSRNTSLQQRLFIKIKALITFYSDEIFHVKRVLIEIKAFILRQTSCLCRIFFTIIHLLSRSISLLLRLFSEIKAFITFQMSSD